MKIKDIREIALHTIRRITSGKPMAEETDMNGKAVIVTGVAQGSIGYETARVLALWGADVVGTTLSDGERTEKALKSSLAQKGMTDAKVAVRDMNLCDVVSVKEFVTQYRREYGSRLGVLVNNAGILNDMVGIDRKPIRTGDGFEIHWRTNFLGPFQLTSLLLPALMETAEVTGESRVVNVSSHIHDRASNDHLFDPPEELNSFQAYALSKLAIVHATFELNRRYGTEHNVHAATLHPGSARTNLQDLGLKNHPKLRFIQNLFNPIMKLFFLTPYEGAQTSIMLSSTRELTGGGYYEDCQLSNAAPSTDAGDVGKRLWDATESWVSTLNTAG